MITSTITIAVIVLPAMLLLLEVAYYSLLAAYIFALTTTSVIALIL